MSSINKVILIGNVGNQPETTHTAAGKVICNFSLATNESYTSKQTGEKITSTEWHRVVSYGKVAEVIEKHLTKGSKIYVEGKLKTSSYDDKQGITRYSTNIEVRDFVFLGGKEGVAGNSNDLPFND
jgi:single-strand DNA-binding protein